MTHKVYHHLNRDDRCQIHILKKKGLKNSEIAKELSVHKSTIGRELRRNKWNRSYHYGKADKIASTRRKKANSQAQKMKGKTLLFVESQIRTQQWSPVQVSGWMRKNMKISVSHQTIYTHIEKNKKQGGDLFIHLRHGKKKYNKRKGKSAGRGLIPNRIDISQRPAIVEEKSRIGDWEIDTIIGKNHDGAIVSMVDRSTKFTKLVLVKNKKADVVASSIQNALGPISDVVHTLTADNGKEFAQHQQIAKFLGATVYFSTPYSSWERGLNEHTNGLVRQYFPKKTSFDKISEDDVQKVEALLNSRPRKILNFMTPLEAFKQARFNL